MTGIASKVSSNCNGHRGPLPFLTLLPRRAIWNLHSPATGRRTLPFIATACGIYCRAQAEFRFSNSAYLATSRSRQRLSTKLKECKQMHLQVRRSFQRHLRLDARQAAASAGL